MAVLGAVVCSVFFFFQAEDGIRDLTVTGVQTCALPISLDLIAVIIASLRETSLGEDHVIHQSLPRSDPTGHPSAGPASSQGASGASAAGCPGEGHQAPRRRQAQTTSGRTRFPGRGPEPARQRDRRSPAAAHACGERNTALTTPLIIQIGRASCRERV